MENEQKSHSIKDTFSRLNSVIFLIILVGALVFCVIMINQALNQTEVPNLDKDSVDTNQTIFDDTTKVRLLRLNPSSNNSGDQPLPPGRINPFSE